MTVAGSKLDLRLAKGTLATLAGPISVGPAQYQRRAEVIDETPVDRTGSVDADPYDPTQTDPD